MSHSLPEPSPGRPSARERLSQENKFNQFLLMTKSPAWKSPPRKEHQSDGTARILELPIISGPAPPHGTPAPLRTDGQALVEVCCLGLRDKKLQPPASHPAPTGGTCWTWTRPRPRSGGTSPHGGWSPGSCQTALGTTGSPTPTSQQPEPKPAVCSSPRDGRKARDT